MAYYDVLIAAWNSSVQPPTGVTGTGLSSAMTTAQKLAAVNAWTITGAVPTNFTVAASDVFNCINFNEFNALTQAQQSNVLAMCHVSGQLLGGSANLSRMAPGMIVSYFPSSGPTIANLTALAKATTQTWCQANSYPYSGNQGLLNGGDLAAAGGLS